MLSIPRPLQARASERPSHLRTAQSRQQPAKPLGQNYDLAAALAGAHYPTQYNLDAGAIDDGGSAVLATVKGRRLTGVSPCGRTLTGRPGMEPSSGYGRRPVSVSSI